MSTIQESVYVKGVTSVLSEGSRMQLDCDPASLSQSDRFSFWPSTRPLKISFELPKTADLKLTLWMRGGEQGRCTIAVNGQDFVKDQQTKGRHTASDPFIESSWLIPASLLKVGNSDITIRNSYAGGAPPIVIQKIAIDFPDNLPVVEPNILKIQKGGYVSIPKNNAYKFATGAFSVMAYITPKKKNEKGETVLTEGTIASSKPAPGGPNFGGWQYFLEYDNGEHYICFKTDDGSGYHLLRAPLNNLYGEKSRANIAGDRAESNKLYREYTHFVTAVNGKAGDLNLYVNGYLLAKATPYDATGIGMDTNSFQLKGIYKEAIDQPTHFFTVKKKDSVWTMGYGDWNVEEFTQLGGSFDLDKEPGFAKVIQIDDVAVQDACGVKAIKVAKLKSQVPIEGAGMLRSDEIVLSIIPKKGESEKVLTQFLANLKKVGSTDNGIGLSIGRTEQYTNAKGQYEGSIKHVSLWNTALSQADIISYMDREKVESDSPDCVGYWKLERDFLDNSSKANHGSGSGTLNFLYEYPVWPAYIEDQINTNWCWAATALGIVEYYNPLSKVTQNEIVIAQKGSEINEGGFSEDYLMKSTNYLRDRYYRDTNMLAKAIKKEKEITEPDSIISNYFLNNSSVNDKVDFGFIKKEIDNGNPVCVAVRWWDSGLMNFNGGHIMILTGIKATEQGDLLIINDPWSGIVYISFEKFLKAYPSDGSAGYWYQTFTTCSNNSGAGAV